MWEEMRNWKILSCGRCLRRCGKGARGEPNVALPIPPPTTQIQILHVNEYGDCFSVIVREAGANFVWFPLIHPLPGPIYGDGVIQPQLPSHPAEPADSFTTQTSDASRNKSVWRLGAHLHIIITWFKTIETNQRTMAGGDEGTHWLLDVLRDVQLEQFYTRIKDDLQVQGLHL